MNKAPKIVIVGAGIGGLTAGLCLSQSGFTVQIVERFEEVREVGAGIMLAPNASFVCYKRLGLGDELDAVSVPMTHFHVDSWRGSTLYGMSVSPGDHPGPARMIHRAALQRVLYDAFDREQILLSSHVTGYEMAGDQIAVLTEDGNEIVGDIVVGADGIHSVIRTQFVGDDPDPLRYHGYTCWRGITTSFEHPDFAFGTLKEVQGKGLRVGMGYIDEDRVYWWATADTPQGETDDPSTIIAELSELYADFPDHFLAMLEATPPQQVLRNDICDRSPLRRWGTEHLTLLGDAAHPMAPNLGQGACSAIEDADMLAICLQQIDRSESALRTYEDLRRRRTAWLQSQSKRFGDVGQWNNGLAVKLRELMTSAFTPLTIKRQLRRLWEYDAQRVFDER